MRSEPGRPEFKARRFHTPVENAIYLLLVGTSATRPTNLNLKATSESILRPDAALSKLGPRRKGGWGGWETPGCWVASLRESGAGGSLRFGRKGIWPGAEGSLRVGRQGGLGRRELTRSLPVGREGLSGEPWGGRELQVEVHTGAEGSLGRRRRRKGLKGPGACQWGGKEPGADSGGPRAGRPPGGRALQESDRLPYGGPRPRLERGGPARASLPIQNFQYWFLKQVGRRLLSCRCSRSALSASLDSEAYCSP
jgi:hypothetical protein